MSRSRKDWMQDVTIKKGALHKSLGIPKGERIPEHRLEKAAHSKSPLLRKRANLAMTFNKSRP